MVLKFRILSISFDLLIPRALGLWEEKKMRVIFPKHVVCEGLWFIPTQLTHHMPPPTSPTLLPQIHLYVFEKNPALYN